MKINESTRPQPRDPSDLRCPFCHDGDFSSLPSLRCSSCLAWQHQECSADHAGACGACGVKQITVWSPFIVNGKVVGYTAKPSTLFTKAAPKIRLPETHETIDSKVFDFVSDPTPEQANRGFTIDRSSKVPPGMIPASKLLAGIHCHETPKPLLIFLGDLLIHVIPPIIIFGMMIAVSSILLILLTALIDLFTTGR